MKSILYSAKPSFGCHFLTKSPRAIGVIFSADHTAEKVSCMYVFTLGCMCLGEYACVYICVRICVNTVEVFPSDYHQIRTQVGLLKIQDNLEDGYYVTPIGTSKTPITFYFSSTGLIFDLNVSFDQDLKLCF